MGLDIYVGTLTRYYSRNWKTAVQQWAEDNGFPFSSLRSDGTPAEDAKPDPQQVERDIKAWRDGVVSGLSDQEETFEPWVEDNERPYYTDKPDWDAFGALLLRAACRLYYEPLPETVEKGWNFAANPTIRRAMDSKELLWSLFSGAETWLPYDGCFSFRCYNPKGDEEVISTLGSLLAELQTINELCWGADEDTILEWSISEGYPADGTLTKDGAIVQTAEHRTYQTESLAKFAFSLFYQAAQFAKRERAVIKLDY